MLFQKSPTTTDANIQTSERQLPSVLIDTTIKDLGSPNAVNVFTNTTREIPLPQEYFGRASHVTASVDPSSGLFRLTTPVLVNVLQDGMRLPASIDRITGEYLIGASPLPQIKGDVPFAAAYQVWFGGTPYSATVYSKRCKANFSDGRATRPTNYFMRSPHISIFSAREK